MTQQNLMNHYQMTFAGRVRYMDIALDRILEQKGGDETGKTADLN